MKAGEVIKQLLNERRMSMRALGRASGIDAATISRLVRGERQPTLDHLQRISDSLQVPVSSFIEIDGEKDGKCPTIGDEIGNLLIDMPVSMASVEEQLRVCEDEAATDVGRSRILEEFGPKLSDIPGQGPFIARLKDFYRRFSKRKGTKRDLILIGSVLLYFILPFDAIPDHLFPIGYLDDALAAQLVARQLSEE